MKKLLAISVLSLMFIAACAPAPISVRIVPQEDVELPGSSRAPSQVTLDGLLPGISSELGGSYAFNIAMTQSTVGLDVSEETALTNTVQEVMSLTHTTTGTPANGIGLEWTATQETSASNNEDIGSVGFYTSDVTAASEDATFSVELMAAGAAKAEKFSIGSTGIASLVGGTTLDNATSADEVVIAETNIQLTGAIDLEGGNVKVNEDSGDYDFSIETDSTDNAFSIDSGNSTLETDGVTITFNQASGDFDVIFETDNVADALTVDAGTDTVLLGTGIVPDFKTADPCGSGFPEGSIFYNDTANVLCFCDGTDDLKIVDGSACF